MILDFFLSVWLGLDIVFKIFLIYGLFRVVKGKNLFKLFFDILKPQLNTEEKKPFVNNLTSLFQPPNNQTNPFNNLFCGSVSNLTNATNCLKTQPSQQQTKLNSDNPPSIFDGLLSNLNSFVDKLSCQQLNSSILTNSSGHSGSCSKLQKKFKKRERKRQDKLQTAFTDAKQELADHIISKIKETGETDPDKIFEKARQELDLHLDGEGNNRTNC